MPVSETMQIMVLGVGNLLYSDEGVGIRAVETLTEHYEFPDNVSLVDGGTLGINLLGTISRADYLIVVDAMRNGGEPGSLYRLEGEEIPKRVLAKNSLHQVDLLDALTLCQALDHVPETVILGIEPQDIETFGIELTPRIRKGLELLAEMVLKELRKVGVEYKKRSVNRHVPCDTCQDY
jgi:hydrogenase maturation protease